MVDEAGLKILDSQLRENTMELDYWLGTLMASEFVARRHIIKEINEELNGSGETGLRPFITNNKVMLTHTWGIIVGQK